MRVIFALPMFSMDEAHYRAFHHYRNVTTSEVRVWIPHNGWENLFPSHWRLAYPPCHFKHLQSSFQLILCFPTTQTKENSFSFIPWRRGCVCILLSKVTHTVTSTLQWTDSIFLCIKKGTVNIFYIKGTIASSATEITWYCRGSNLYWLQLFKDCKQTLEEHLLLSMEMTKCSHNYLSFMVRKKICITTGHIILGWICSVFLKEMHDKHRCSLCPCKLTLNWTFSRGQNLIADLSLLTAAGVTAIMTYLGQAQLILTQNLH